MKNKPISNLDRLNAMVDIRHTWELSDFQRSDSTKKYIYDLDKRIEALAGKIEKLMQKSR